MADQDTPEREEGLVDVGAAFVADAEASELVQPGDGALDDPALPAEAGAVLGLALGQLGLNVAASQFSAMPAGVIGPIAEELLRSAPWSPASPADRWDRVEQGQRLGDVVDVGSGERERQRRAAPADHGGVVL